MRGGAQSPGSKTVTQLPAPRGSSDSGSAGHMERGSLVAWEASGRCGEMAVHSFTAQQRLVVTTFDHCALGSGDTGGEPLPVSVRAVVLQHGDTMGGLGGIHGSGTWSVGVELGPRKAPGPLLSGCLLPSARPPSWVYSFYTEPVPRQDFPCHRGTVLRQEAGGPSGRRPHGLSGFSGH